MMNLDLPEMTHTINYIVPPVLAGISLFLLSGILFLVAAIIQNKFGKPASGRNLLLLFLIFWVPGYIVHFYNNFYDTYENLQVLSKKDEVKLRQRFCNMDKYQGFNGSVCGILDLYSRIEQSIPAESKLYLKGFQSIYPYAYYWYYPRFKFVRTPDEADFILYYYPANLYFDPIGSTIKLRAEESPVPGDEKLLNAKYRIVAGLNQDALLLQKIQP